MFERLQSFLQSLGANRGQGNLDPNDPLVSVSALCIQVMESDGVVHESEKQRLRELLRTEYGLDDERLEAILKAGKKAEREAVDYFRFTSELKRALDEEQRLKLIGILWDIVYSDNQRSEIEDHVVWRIADLLGISDRDRVLQRQEAATRARMKDDGDVA